MSKLTNIQKILLLLSIIIVVAGAIIIVTIGDHAFESLVSSHMIHIIVPASVINLGTGIFKADELAGTSYTRSTLESVTFLGDVKNVDENMFDGCQILKTVKFLGNVGNIENRAFSNLPYLDEVSFSKSVGQIGGQAFINCESLTSVMIPDSVADIGDYAFGYTGNPGTVTNPVPGFKILRLCRHCRRDLRHGKRL